MKRTFFASLIVLLTLGASAAIVTYTPDNSSIFPNPERGFTEEFNKVVTASSPYVLKGNESWFDSQTDERKSMSLVVVLYNFKSYKTTDLPQEILNGFDTDMQLLRDKGWKCVLRFAYTETESDKVDATPDWVQKHLAQLKPYLEKNADVIYVLEAGFVGVWGEWYYTSNYGNESQHMNDKRRTVVDALLQTAPTDMFVLFRYPMLKNEYFGDKTPLTSFEAFTGTPRARMGHHNDAFLNAWGDMGTYASNSKSDDPEMRQFIANETLYLPNGGETNIEGTSDAEKMATYEKTIDAMSKYHWSFCGSSYAQAATGKWRREGTFDEANRRLGYRFQLSEANLSDSVAPGGKCNITIYLKNTGFAPLYNKRNAYIVFKNSTDTYSLPLKSDPRRWLPNGATSIINEQIDIPTDMPVGEYNVYLYLPDTHTTIADNPRFAIRFANNDVWEQSTGMNSLLMTISVSTDAALNPGELPQITAVETLKAVEADSRIYDLLGREVDENFSGIVVKQHRKIMTIK